MKKGNVLSLFCMACVSMLFAQNYVYLTFTSKLQDDTWLAFDSIRITNQSRTWTETLYYPDTTLRMINSVGIEESESSEFKLYQNMPNPCNGTAAFRLQLPIGERVDIKLFDINGKEITTYSEQLESGMHEFTLRVAAAQVYVLQAKTATQTQSITLVSTESGKGNSIKHASFIPMQQATHQKANTDKVFVSNDTMQYVAYCTYGGSVKTKTIRLAQEGNNTTHTFVIPMGYAVGDVYYKSGGTAEGIVCWLADTVINIGGVPYGSHGKMISLDEGYKLMYSANNPAYPTRAYDSLDGRVNTAIHIAITLDTNYKFPERLAAAIWCTAKGEEWYFPAKCEMDMLYELVSVLNAELQKIGATQFTTSLSSGTVYWSSTEEVQVGSNPCRAFGIYFNSGLKGAYPVYDQLRVRAMKWF